MNWKVIFFIDNGAAFAMVCKIGARESDHRNLVWRIWQVIKKNNINCWFMFVPSEQNCADCPSRANDPSGSWKLELQYAIGKFQVVDAARPPVPTYKNFC